MIIIIITARKRSLRQGNVFTRVCHSVHRGEVSVRGVSVRETPGQRHPYGKERTARILLECILVLK